MTGAASTAARLMLVVGAVCICAAVAAAGRSEQRCSEAGAAVLRNVVGTAPGTDALDDALGTLRQDCTDTRGLLVAARALAGAGREGEAAPLARRAVRLEPDNPGAWAALFAALRRSDPTAAARARERAVELNPLAGS